MLGNSQFLVYFHMRKYTISCEFPQVETRISAARIYTYFCVFPHAEFDTPG